MSVTAGLAPGERVVTAGSFSLRAEAERQGLRPAAPAGAPGAAMPLAQQFEVKVTTKGFEPDALTLEAGRPVRLTFTRTTDQTCATDVVVPAYGIRKPLPLKQPVTVEFVPKKGSAGFVCGMNMLKGTLVVR